MKPRNLSPLLALLSAALMPAQISAPRIGAVRYSNGDVRAVYGVPYNFVVAGQIAGSADAVSFSDSGGLVAHDGKLQLLAADLSTTVAECSTGEKAPVPNIDGDLSTAVAWLPERNSLLRWTGSSFALLELGPGTITGSVTSLRLVAPETAQLLATQPAGDVLRFTVSLQTGNIVSADPLPGVRGPAFFQANFVVFHDDQGLEIESPNGNIHTLALNADDLSAERMSTEWVHLFSPSLKQHWALHLSSSSLDLSALPGTSAREGSR